MKRPGLIGLVVLGGCASAPSEPPAARPAPRAAAAYVHTIAGLESVIGRSARTIEALFGRPDLDVREGTARKLQFGSQVCVLDAYLYPPSGGGKEPIVTHVDARLPDGRDMDRASCVAALSRRPEAR